MEQEKTSEIRQYYKDAMTNYLIIRCPETTLEGYQYRMLAINRVQGLLPCSVRKIDGESFLYYEITSRQNIARIYEHRFISGKEMKQILYSLAQMNQMLEEYLLDSDKLILDPEYIFFDYEAEKFYFVYFPEIMPEENLQKLIEYLTEKSDPENAESTAVIYRLCDLASHEGFILREEVLDEEWDKAKEKNVEAGKAEIEDEYLLRNQNPDLRINRNERKLKETDTATGYEGVEKEEYSFNDDIRDMETESGDEKQVKKRKSKRKRKKKDTSSSKILGLSVILLCLSGIGESIILFGSINKEMIFALRAGTITSLVMSILTAGYGVIYIRKKNKKEDQEKKNRQEEEKNNAMMPAVEYQMNSDNSVQKARGVETKCFR